MSFHVKASKSSVQVKKLRFPLAYRLSLAGFGTVTAWFASFPRNPANFMYLNWRGQQIYPNSFVPVGILLIVISILPASWLAAVVRRLDGG
jgi:hypothetical protein